MIFFTSSTYSYDRDNNQGKFDIKRSVLVRLKNKKIALTFFMLHGWCHGLPQNESIRSAAEKMITHLKEIGYNVKFIALTDLDVTKFLDELGASATEKLDIIEQARAIVRGGSSSSSSASDGADIVDKLLAQGFNLQDSNGQQRAMAFLQQQGVSSIKERNNIIKEALQKTPAVPKHTPTAPEPKGHSVATDAQIDAWVHKHGEKIVEQLKLDGVMNAADITFEKVHSAARKIGNAPIPTEHNQQTYLLGRLSGPKMPPPPPGKMPPPPPPPKTQTWTREQLEDIITFGGNLSEAQKQFARNNGWNLGQDDQQANNQPQGKMPPPPPPLPGKTPPPPPPPPAKTSTSPKVSDLKLNAAGAHKLVEEIKRMFNGAHTPKSPAQPSTPKVAPQQQVNPKLVIEALELASTLPNARTEDID